MLEHGPLLRKAEIPDAPAIAALVNSATSGDGATSGWTYEANFFRGDRTDSAEVLEMLAAPQSMFLLRLRGTEIVGCVYLKLAGTAGYLGLLAVRPALQARGLGKQLIAEGERIACDEWGCATMVITVITSHRPELTVYYQRRGYRRTRRFKAFERKQALNGAKVEGLRLEWMEKELCRIPAPEAHDLGSLRGGVIATGAPSGVDDA